MRSPMRLWCSSVPRGERGVWWRWVDVQTLRSFLSVLLPRKRFQCSAKLDHGQHQDATNDSHTHFGPISRASSSVGWTVSAPAKPVSSAAYALHGIVSLAGMSAIGPSCVCSYCPMA